MKAEKVAGLAAAACRAGTWISGVWLGYRPAAAEGEECGVIIELSTSQGLRLAELLDRTPTSRT